MRILVVGAGAIGGYFGARLLAAGADVTFLVRQRRAAELAADGLVVRSPQGDLSIPNPPTVLAEHLAAPFDLVILSCKAYDLSGAIESLAPAVGPDTAILPLLNGMRHLDALDARFGRARVLGGQCVAALTLDERRAIVHLNPLHSLAFGERDSGTSHRIEAIARAFAGVTFEAHRSDDIVQAMWEKWVFLATLAGSTCLMRAAIGDIVAAPGGQALIEGLLAECAAIATANGHAPRATALDPARAMLTATDSPLTASMLRDVENGAAIEADHIIGDLLARGASATTYSGPASSTLALTYTHLKAYEGRRARTSRAAASAIDP